MTFCLNGKSHDRKCELTFSTAGAALSLGHGGVLAGHQGTGDPAADGGGVLQGRETEAYM